LTRDFFERRSLAIVAIGAVIAFLALEILSLQAGLRDYDEGVYWQTLRALARGAPLFSSVFASEPPVFFYSLLPFDLLGHSIAAIRLGVVFFGVVGVVAAYLAGRWLAGNQAGLAAAAMVATAPFYLDQAAILQSDGPAIALALLAMALMIGAVRQTSRAERILAAASGLVLALGVGTKLSTVLAVVPIAIVVLGSRRVGAGIAFVSGGLVGAALILVPVASAWPASYQQLVQSHLIAGSLVHRSFAVNLPSLVLSREIPLEALAAAATVVAIARKDWRIAAPLGWGIITVVAILFYQPLFLHHLVQLVPPLALLVGVGVANVWSWRPSLRAAAAAAVLLVSAYGVSAGIRHTATALRAGGHEAQLATALAGSTRPGDFVISDNQFAVAQADRDIPPPVIDTSRQVIADGLLTITQIDAAARRYGVGVVLVDGERLLGMPGFRQWLADNYVLARPLGGSANLYRRASP
jgi:4-amino-4-deoxy-L-arabinose transferase-like glycosyltransferase